MARVRCQNVTKVYPGNVLAVKNLTMEVKDREFVVLVGPSGCGKSTTLRMIAGLEEITDGEIYIGDRLVNDVAPKDREIAMVFQNYALYPHMSVYKNMAFGLKLRKFPKAEIDTRVREAAEILGISDFLERRPRALSGGQRQRVALGRAIVRKPLVFLFDEPLSNLDAKMRTQMRAELSKLHNRLQATMIYVTHDQLEAMTMGDRIVVMKDGLIHQVANPIELYDHPVNKFVAGFIGTPPMNFIEGRLERQNGASYFRTPSLSVRLPERMNKPLASYVDKEVVFGIRPEDVRASEQFAEIDKSRCVRAKVEVIEPLGSESIWYLATPESSFIAKVDSHTDAEVDREKELVLFVEKAHVFDKQTEWAIV